MALKARTYLSVVAPRHPSDTVFDPNLETKDKDGNPVKGGMRPTRPGDLTYKPRTRFIKPGELIPEPLDQKTIDDHVKRGEKIPSHMTQADIDELVSNGSVVDESELHLGQDPAELARKTFSGSNPDPAPTTDPDASPGKKPKGK